MIAFRNVVVSYKPDRWRAPRIPILDGVSAILPSRSHVAVLGGAGSGKTTLLKVLCGSLPPNRGIVQRQGTVSFPVGFVGASGRVSVSQYVQFVAKCYCVDPKAFLRRVLSFAEIEDLLHRPTGKLEPDRRSRLNMAIGYLLPFDHYLFDSRIAASDPAFRAKCLQQFELRQRAAGTVLATRSAAVARQFCTSAAVLHAGRLIYFEDIDRALDFYAEIEPNPKPRTTDPYYAPTDPISYESAPEQTEA